MTTTELTLLRDEILSADEAGDRCGWIADRIDRILFAPRPTVVCLCGSTRFYTTFQEANYRETTAGKIVLSVGFYPHAQDEAHGGDVGVTPEQKVKLDELHKRKIDLADEVLVLNVDGYIGDSTRSEILHAQTTGKPVRWWDEARIPEV